jgi:hypothetical protein
MIPKLMISAKEMAVQQFIPTGGICELMLTQTSVPVVAYVIHVLS